MRRTSWHPAVMDTEKCITPMILQDEMVKLFCNTNQDKNIYTSILNIASQMV